MSTKQVIVVRKDLNMGAGKIAAQVGHAVLGAFLMNTSDKYPVESVFNGGSSDKFGDVMYEVQLSRDAHNWLEDSYKKVVVGTEDLFSLMELYEKAQLSGLPFSLITDSGKTVFDGVSTVTCLAIGPGLDEEVDKITKGLKLL